VGTEFLSGDEENSGKGYGWWGYNTEDVLKATELHIKVIKIVNFILSIFPQERKRKLPLLFCACVTDPSNNTTV
jgi:hypothetical protein